MATIRQPVEIRLRHAFGIVGKERVNDGQFTPFLYQQSLTLLRHMQMKWILPFLSSMSGASTIGRISICIRVCGIIRGCRRGCSNIFDHFWWEGTRATVVGR